MHIRIEKQSLYCTIQIHNANVYIQYSVVFECKVQYIQDEYLKAKCKHLKYYTKDLHVSLSASNTKLHTQVFIQKQRKLSSLFITRYTLYRFM